MTNLADELAYDFSAGVTDNEAFVISFVKTMKKRHLKEKAGVVAYRSKKGDDPLILVVSARKFKNQWVFPVGSVKQGESLEATARRECAEESGYLVDAGERLPSIDVAGNGATMRFTFFLATVVGEVDQWETDRRRLWLPAGKVVALLPEIFQGVAQRAVDQILRKWQCPEED